MYHVSTQSPSGTILNPKTKFGLPFKEILLSSLVNGFPYFERQISNKDIMAFLGNNTGWPLSKLITEAIFEYVRLSDFGEEPSRLTSTYLFDSLKKAQLFNSRHRENKGKIFEISKVSKEDCCCFDMKIFTKADNIVYSYYSLHSTISTEIINEVISLAKSYWESSGCFEGEEFLYKDVIILP